MLLNELADDVLLLFSVLSSGREVKFDGLTLGTCHSIINLMDVSFHITDSLLVLCPSS